MATPRVTGAAALLLSRGYTTAETWEQLAGTTTDLGFRGFDQWTGWGRIDVLAAVTQAPSFLPIGDTTPPQVWFTSPADGSSLSGTSTTIKVGARDETKLEFVELRLRWVEKTGNITYTYTMTLATSTKAALSYTLPTSNLKSGTYTLIGNVVDGIGQLSTTSITVTRP
jgi:Bacterial Ig domain